MTAQFASLLPWTVAFKAVTTTLLLAIHRDPVDLVLQVARAVHRPKVIALELRVAELRVGLRAGIHHP